MRTGSPCRAEPSGALRRRQGRRGRPAAVKTPQIRLMDPAVSHALTPAAPSGAAPEQDKAAESAGGGSEGGEQ